MQKEKRNDRLYKRQIVLHLVLGVALVAMATAAPACHYVRQRDRALDTRASLLLPSMSLPDCHQACLDLPDPCRSFNYHADVNLCTLHESEASAGGIFRTQPGTDYYERSCGNQLSQASPCSGYQCANEACINPAYACDGKDDCGDGSDENMCDDYLGDDPDSHGNDANLPSNEPISASGGSNVNNNDDDDDSEDDDDDDTNISSSYLSSRVEDGYLVCWNGNKVIHWWICDGDNDCGDLTDESDCRPSHIPDHIPNMEP